MSSDNLKFCGKAGLTVAGKFHMLEQSLLLGVYSGPLCWNWSFLMFLDKPIEYLSTGVMETCLPSADSY